MEILLSVKETAAALSLTGQIIHRNFSENLEIWTKLLYSLKQIQQIFDICNFKKIAKPSRMASIKRAITALGLLGI